MWWMSDLLIENSTSLLIYISNLIDVPLSLFQILATPVRINTSQMFPPNLGTWWNQVELINDKKKKNRCRPFDWPPVLPSNLAPRQQLMKEADVHAVLINTLTRRTHLCWECVFISFPHFYYKHINTVAVELGVFMRYTSCWAGLLTTRAQKDHS